MKNKINIHFIFIRFFCKIWLRRRGWNVGFLDFEIGIFFVVFWRDFYHGFVEQDKKTTVAVQFSVLFNRQIAHKFIQHISRLGSRLDAV